MPQERVDCVRVPHPFAGRQQILLSLLPLDLHVLSLPLAFILSQDQTLHCKWIVQIWLNSLKLFQSLLRATFLENQAYLIIVFFAIPSRLRGWEFALTEVSDLPAVRNFIRTCCCFPIFQRTFSLVVTLMITRDVWRAKGLEPLCLRAFNPRTLYFF